MKNVQDKIKDISKLQQEVIDAMPAGAKKDKAKRALQIADAVCGINDKKPRGLNGGRKLKYTEKLVHFTARVPASKVEDLRKIIAEMKINRQII